MENAKIWTAARGFANESKNVLSEEDKVAQSADDKNKVDYVMTDENGKEVTDVESLFHEAKEKEGEQAYLPPASTEVKKGASKTHEFQAETSRILEIMAKSLYTDKEVRVSFCAFPLCFPMNSCVFALCCVCGCAEACCVRVGVPSRADLQRVRRARKGALPRGLFASVCACVADFVVCNAEHEPNAG